MHIDLTQINKNRFLIGIIINAIFVFVELYYGFQANSVSLLADAVHNASDVIGLALVWFGYRVAQHEATYKYTYGFKGATIIAAFLNSVVLIIAVGNVMWESTLRLMSPQVVQPITMIVVALVGMVINGLTAFLFMNGKDRDIGILSVYLNFSLDLLLSLAVAVGGILIISQNWYFVDPILGFLIGITIIVSLWRLFKESFELFFQAVPNNIISENIVAEINKIPGVVSYHDLHIWALSTTETAISVHIVIDKAHYSSSVVEQLSNTLKDKYEIVHSTIQLEQKGSPSECTI